MTISDHAVCERLYLFTLGHEYSPSWVSLEGTGDELLRLPVTGGLVLTAEGWLLLETGLNPELLSDPDSPVRAIYGDALPELPSADPLLSALAACRLEPADLRAVAVSHLHVDHAGGLRHFSGGPPIYIQRTELEFGLNTATEREAYWRADYDRPGLDFRPLDGEGTILPGVEAVGTPGHTPGHMSYRVHMRSGAVWLLAIDAIDLQEGIDRDIVIGASADPRDISLCRPSHERLVSEAQATGARLVPGHCPLTWPALWAPPAFYG